MSSCLLGGGASRLAVEAARPGCGTREIKGLIWIPRDDESPNPEVNLASNPGGSVWFSEIQIGSLREKRRDARREISPTKKMSLKLRPQG